MDGPSLRQGGIALAIGTPGLAALAVAVAAVTAGLPRAGSLAGLLLLPLAVPLLIFGAAERFAAGSSGVPAADAGAPFVAGAAIRASRTYRPAREDGGRQQQPPRLLAHRHLAHLDRPAEIADDLLYQFADRQRRHPHRIDGQHEESAVRIEQPAAVGEQRREIFLQPPDLACRTAAELGRIEQDAVVAPSRAALRVR